MESGEVVAAFCAEGCDELQVSGDVCEVDGGGGCKLVARAYAVVHFFFFPSSLSLSCLFRSKLAHRSQCGDSCSG